MPPANRRGRTPASQQDKPDPDDFVEAMATPAHQSFGPGDTGRFGHLHRFVVDRLGGSAVDIDGRDVTITHGPWTLRTTTDNVVDATPVPVPALARTSPVFRRGVLYLATSSTGLLLELANPIPGVDPTGRLRADAVVVDAGDDLRERLL